jgi:hypothetical protein
MNDLRAAAQQALEALGKMYTPRQPKAEDFDLVLAAITALRAALAQQQEQEPVASQNTQEKCRIETVPAKGGLLSIHPPRRETEQEPVGEVVCIDDNCENGPEAIVQLHNPVELGQLLYTHPPRREWVSLTDEERANILFPLTAAGASDMECARAVEQACKEKNQ